MTFEPNLENLNLISTFKSAWLPRDLLISLDFFLKNDLSFLICLIFFEEIVGFVLLAGDVFLIPFNSIFNIILLFIYKIIKSILDLILLDS